MNEINARVGAVLKADKTTIHFFGYGKYTGDEIPPEEVRGFNIGVPNPKIELDNGKTVFGCECWWGSVDEIKKMIGNRKVIDVDIDEMRKCE